jgi:hypothetical protein
MRSLILDLATAAVDNAAEYITFDDISAPSNYKDPEKIAAFIEAARAERLAKAALDLDLCRITAIGCRWMDGDGETQIVTILHPEEERPALQQFLSNSKLGASRLVSFNGLKFDWPVLMRRCAYLGLPVPKISLDKYRTSHIDVYDVLTYHGAVSGHSLGWYAKRMGWTDLVKPLSGAEEAQVPQTGRWDDLRESLRHDITATERLAGFLGVSEPVL